MTAAALVISVVALGLAGVAYWRSGGDRDVARLEAGLRREVSELHAKQSELVDHASQSLSAAYDRSRVRLRATRSRIRQLQEAAVKGLDVQLRRAAEQLEDAAAVFINRLHLDRLGVCAERDQQRRTRVPQVVVVPMSAQPRLCRPPRTRPTALRT